MSTIWIAMLLLGQIQVKENLDLPYDAIGELDEELAPEIVIFYGQSYEGDGVYFLLDRSSSTRDGEFAIEQRELVKAISEFSDRVEFAIVFFDTGIRQFPLAPPPREATPGNKAAAIAWAQSLQSGSGTCPREGFAELFKYIRMGTTKRKVAIYLGDGCTTCPGYNVDNYRESTLALVRTLNTERISIHAICVGRPGSTCPRFPQELAGQNGGNFTRITR